MFFDTPRKKIDDAIISSSRHRFKLFMFLKFKKNAFKQHENQSITAILN